MNDYLSLCLICKDENDYLPEWLDYHILLGVDRFYIYDNDSKVSLRVSLDKYIKNGWVSVFEIHGRGVQLHAYDHCIQNFGSQTFWMGFIDTDEFLVLKEKDNLKEFLRDYEAYGGFAVSSLFFGSDGNSFRPGCGQVAGYQTRTHQTFADNGLIKSIVQPDKIVFPNSPHDFIYKPGYFCVNERKLRVDYQRFPNYIEKIQLNHYFCRSLDEIEQKLQRGRGAAASSWARQRFDNVNRNALYRDDTALKNLLKLFQARGKQKLLLNDLIEKNVLVENLAELAGLQKTNFTPLPSQAEIVFRPVMVDFLNKKSALDAAENENRLLDVKQLMLSWLAEMPYWTSLYVDLAVVLIRLDENEPAWQLLSQAWQMARNSYKVLVGMTHFFLRNNNYGMAEKTCKLLFDIAPNDLIVLGFMVESLLGLGQYEEAVNIGLPFIDTVSMVGELPEGMSLLLIQKMSDYLVQNNQYPKAIHLWEAGLKLSPGNASPLIEMGKVYLHQGNRAMSKEVLTRAKNLFPDNQEIKDLLIRVNLTGLKKN
ncbi:MAG: glycosyltransferase family 92 protein [Anaerolineae bacterium]|nr:glycosyltransferase family 92 protein [Anaerolineae bacterium]